MKKNRTHSRDSRVTKRIPYPTELLKHSAMATLVSPGPLVVLSGVAGQSRETGEVPEGITAQLEMACQQALESLKAAGSSSDKVFKIVTYFSELEDIPTIIAIRRKHFRMYATTTIRVAGFARPGMRVELDIWATL